MYADQSSQHSSLFDLQANIPQEEVLDPAEAKRRAIEAEEARLAAQRAHGTQVTPETFVEWRKRFDAELALQKARRVSNALGSA